MTKKDKPKEANVNPHRPNFWGFLQNVLIASMSRGQLLGMTVAVIFIIIIIRYPGDQLPALVDRLIDITNLNRILGWICFVVVTFVSYLILRRQRITHNREMNRIAEEKKNLQQRLSKQELPSSNK